MMNLLLRWAASTVLPLVIAVSTADLSEAQADFDFNVYAMSYQPEFCYSHRKEHWVGCHPNGDYLKTHLTIHGLWPEVA